MGHISTHENDRVVKDGGPTMVCTSVLCVLSVCIVYVCVCVHVRVCVCVCVYQDT